MINQKERKGNGERKRKRRRSDRNCNMVGSGSKFYAVWGNIQSDIKHKTCDVNFGDSIFPNVDFWRYLIFSFERKDLISRIAAKFDDLTSSNFKW